MPEKKNVVTVNRFEGRKQPTRSIRVDNETWERVKERAQDEGITPSYALYLITVAYAEGAMDLPEVKLYIPNAGKQARERSETRLREEGVMPMSAAVPAEMIDA